MKFHRFLIFVLAASAPVFVGVAQGAVANENPPKREATLEQAAELLAPRENPAAKLPAELVDPFNPPGFGAAHAGGKPGEKGHIPVSDREILENIATRITPSGMVMFNDNPLLLFREKKLKVGDTLTITFEGTDYVVVITEIEATSFKIRLNREEVTRPIKPGKAP
ncbi:MAG TPA: hypothetical protein VLW52_04535 [Opitutaceae bacterium]|nr:hypothetical protein [Opitutaceae bacterium]